MKRITIKADTTLKYLQLWNGIFNLTDMEIQVLSALIDKAESLDDICNASLKKSAAVVLKIDDYRTLINYVKRLKDIQLELHIVYNQLLQFHNYLFYL